MATESSALLGEQKLKIREGGSTVFGAIVNFYKSMVGAGVLSIANIFTYAGLWGGIVAYFIIALIALYSQFLLLRVKQLAEASYLHRHRCDTAPLQTYADVSELIAGKRGRRVVEVLVISLQLSFCAGFLIIVGDHLHDIAPALSARAYIFLSVLPLSLLCWVRWIKDLWILSLFGVLVYVIGVMGAVFWYGISHFEVIDYVDVDWLNLWQFFGMAIYTLEGTLGVLPIETSMHSPHHFPAVLTSTMAFIFLSFSSLGAFAYVLGYGKCAIITNCIPAGYAVRTTLKVALVVSLIATYPLQHCIGTEIVEQILLPESVSLVRVRGMVIGERERERESGGEEDADGGDEATPDRSTLIHVQVPDTESLLNHEPNPPTRFLGNEGRRRVIRVIQVVFTAILAAAIPDFEMFTSIVGGLLLASAGFVVPAWLHIRLLSHPELKPASAPSTAPASDVAIITIGVCFMVLGVTSTLYRAVK